MKKILITQRLETQESYCEQRDILHTTWSKLFHKINILPILLPSHYDFKTYIEELNIDGVLLSGGNDLNSLNSNANSKKRDTLEVEIISYCIENTLPLYGVCRGMQVIAEYFGSSFHKVDGHVGTIHILTSNTDSKYHTYLSKIPQVNSYHSYAIKTLAEALISSAKDTNGEIEAIEHPSHKIFGQMWHPERNIEFNENELNLLNAFFNQEPLK